MWNEEVVCVEKTNWTTFLVLIFDAKTSITHRGLCSYKMASWFPSCVSSYICLPTVVTSWLSFPRFSTVKEAIVLSRNLPHLFETPLFPPLRAMSHSFPAHLFSELSRHWKRRRVLGTFPFLNIAPHFNEKLKSQLGHVS